MQSFVSITNSLPDVATDVDHSVERYLQQPSSIFDVSSHSVTLYVLSVQCTDQVPLNIGRVITRRNGCLVSTTELLKCHAFTGCLLLVMLPKGIRIEGFCTPKRHFEAVLRINLISAAAVASNGDNKPKALPLSVSQAARQGLAKIATPEITQKQSQSHQSGYVHGLTVATVSTLPKPRYQETSSQGNVLPGNFNIAQRDFPENSSQWDNQHDDLQSRPKRVLRRSRSAGQSPLTPSRRTGISGNSKSCPPARLKSSPIRDVMKHGGKTRKDQNAGLECMKGENGVLKRKHTGLPLRRAGLDTSRKLDFFKKPSERLFCSPTVVLRVLERLRGCSYD